MSASTFTPTHCDACGHAYRESEKRGLMHFMPTGAYFEVSYSVCMECLPRIPSDTALTNNAIARAMERVPALLAFAKTGGNA